MYSIIHYTTQWPVISADSDISHYDFLIDALNSGQVHGRCVLSASTVPANTNHFCMLGVLTM